MHGIFFFHKKTVEEIAADGSLQPKHVDLLASRLMRNKQAFFGWLRLGTSWRRENRLAAGQTITFRPQLFSGNANDQELHVNDLHEAITADYRDWLNAIQPVEPVAIPAEDQTNVHLGRRTFFFSAAWLALNHFIGQFVSI